MGDGHGKRGRKATSGIWIQRILECGSRSYRISTILHWKVPHAHNGFIDLTLQSGLVGLALFMVVHFIAVRRAMVFAYSEPGKEAMWPLAYLAFIVLYQVTESTIFVGNTILDGLRLYRMLSWSVGAGRFRAAGPSSPAGACVSSLSRFSPAARVHMTTASRPTVVIFCDHLLIFQRRSSVLKDRLSGNIRPRLPGLAESQAWSCRQAVATPSTRVLQPERYREVVFKLFGKAPDLVRRLKALDPVLVHAISAPTD